MGKWLVKAGLWVQATWKKGLCIWNKGVSKLIVKVEDCPYKMCNCKK